MYSKELEELINAALADGIITDKERSVIKKRAEKEGIDPDEIDVYLDGKLAQSQAKRETIANEKPKIQQAVTIPQNPKKSSYNKYLLVIALCIIAIIASQFLIKEKPLAKQIAEREINKNEILGKLNACAEIASTEVKIRRMAIYDSEESEKSDFTRPNTWKIGDRGCIVPVDITIEYGIDLRKMNENSIMIDSGNVVIIKLPSPELIKSDYNEYTEQDDVLTFKSGLRDEVGEKTIQKIKRKTFESVINDTTLLDNLKKEIDENTKIIFGSMIREMSLEPRFIY